MCPHHWTCIRCLVGVTGRSFGATSDAAIAAAYLAEIKDDELVEIMQHVMFNGGRHMKRFHRRGIYVSMF